MFKKIEQLLCSHPIVIPIRENDNSMTFDCVVCGKKYVTVRRKQ